MNLTITQQATVSSLANGITTIAPELKKLLKARYDSAKKTQLRNGIQFDLTFDEFLTLVGAGKRQTITKQMKAGTTNEFFRSYSGYCLTWKDKAAFEGKVMNVETAVYITRRMSRRINQFTTGDKHTDASKAKISASKTGSKHKASTKKKISAALTGKDVSDETRAKMAASKRGTTKSPEERARISATMKATKAAKRAALEAANGKK